MAESHLISGLVTKRAELAGELARLRQRIDALTGDIAAVDRVLRISGYTGEPSTDIRPIQRRETVTRRGSLSDAVMDILREASQPLRTTEIADIIATRRGLSFATSDQKESFREHVRQGIRRLRQRGVIEMLGEGAATVWRVAS